MDIIDLPLNQIVTDTMSKSFQTVFQSQVRGECIKQGGVHYQGVLVLLKSGSKRGR